MTFREVCGVMLAAAGVVWLLLVVAAVASVLAEGSGVDVLRVWGSLGVGLCAACGGLQIARPR